jgi:hypothetical protein
MKTAKQLREARKAAGISSMTEAAKLTDTPYKTWKNWESGVRRVPGWPFIWLKMYQQLKE